MRGCLAVGNTVTTPVPCFFAAARFASLGVGPVTYGTFPLLRAAGRCTPARLAAAPRPADNRGRGARWSCLPRWMVGGAASRSRATPPKSLRSVWGATKRRVTWWARRASRGWFCAKRNSATAFFPRNAVFSSPRLAAVRPPRRAWRWRSRIASGLVASPPGDVLGAGGDRGLRGSLVHALLPAEMLPPASGAATSERAFSRCSRTLAVEP